MKQALVNLRSGEVIVDDVPPPVMKGEGVIVENHFSVISAGTESMLINLAGSSYIGKARQKPDMFMKVVELAKKQGPITAYKAVTGRLDKPEPMGYSCAGIVTKTSENSPFNKGDRVACGGVGYANHADMVFVPKNLCVKVPDDVSLRDASFTTLGSIAMQGVRNADVRVGERVAVIGLGLIGQLTVQILKASGCEVFGIEIDIKKIDLAKKLGLDDGCQASAENIESQAESFTEGVGFDSVIITAATRSNEPLELAGKISRKKGRVVLVGLSGMEIPRDIYYPKELEFVISCSYGPGRYDPEYEEMGHDYPIGYIRWTEKRNMESFLKLLSQKKIVLDYLISHEFHIEKAADAYELISSKKKKAYMGIVLAYDIKKDSREKFKVEGTKKKTHKGDVNIGWIGAGSFATTTLLPAIKGIDGISLVGLSVGSGASSKSTAKVHGFRYVTSDHKVLLKDKDIDAIVVTTRNSLHAKMAIEAIEAGKHVFVEKPLALTVEELDGIVKAHKKNPDMILQVGYNRRYAPVTVRMREFFKDRKGPMMILYRINAGKMPSNSWVYEDREGGSRFISELCHFVDFCQYMIGSPIVDHHHFKVDHPALSVKESMENVAMTLKMKDGSLASIVYNTVGESSTSKEFVEIYCENAMARMTDFRQLELIRGGHIKRFKDLLKTDKGHREEIIHFIEDIRKGKNDLMGHIRTMKVILDR